MRTADPSADGRRSAASRTAIGGEGISSHRPRGDNLLLVHRNRVDVIQKSPRRMYGRVTNIRISAHSTHLRKLRNFVFATEVTIFSDHCSPLMYLRECAPKSAKLTRWALGLQEFMHADSNIFHTSVNVYTSKPVHRCSSVGAHGVTQLRECPRAPY